MNIEAYGISDADALLNNVVFIKLVSGENLITYAVSNGDGLSSFLPFEIKDHEGDFILVPYLPFIKEKIFFMAFTNLQFIKASVHQYVIDQYKKISLSLFKSDIEDLLSACKRLQEANAQVSISKELVTIH